jgi:hypothetical protein
VTREPAITFRGALKILGHDDRSWLDRLDRLLGGVILASGLTPVSAVWGWVDQKNEATGLLRGVLNAVSGRLDRAGGLARHELVVAAHTTLVLSAFFETLRDALGQTYDKAKFTKAEKVMLGTGNWKLPGEQLVRHLYESDVPVPSAVRGFEENVEAVHRWAFKRMITVGSFLDGLGFGDKWSKMPFLSTVAKRYRSNYLRLATAVPEFKVWADLGEHAATRTALARLEALLSHAVRQSAPRDLRAVVAGLNRTELSRPVIDIDTDGYGFDAVFPAVERIFRTPHFRCATANRDARIGDEQWWTDVHRQHDLDAVLARHFSTPDSTRLPLLLLGHPGAGKSLLTKVLAARLPESTYTVVRVPLRRVDADTTISAQVGQALADATHGRVSWPELVDQSAETIRVILLDGLDELLQATTNDRAGYLTDIAEFQRIEAAMGKPVAVVVTSRTLVADRVRVPEGTPVLKLEEFDDDQIAEWLRVWHEVNGATRPVTPNAVMAHRELARQPLLLLMLTLYFADPAVAPTAARLSTLQLYQRLFDTYARREVTKQAGRVLPPAELTEAVHGQLNRLAIAAVGMFNRGRQSITEAELGADLAALGEPTGSGRRLLGEFFFVHAPEAVEGEVRRGYEFLHATFGEHLVATKVVEVLAEVAEGAYGRRRFHEPDDELLFALLSHQPLALSRPTLDFIVEYFAEMDARERTHALQTLELLISGYRHRRPASRYPDYRPQPADTVRALAAYSANLVLLRVLTDPGSGSDFLDVPLATLWPGQPNAWPATMNLWAAGLDADCYRATVSAFTRRVDSLVFNKRPRYDRVRFDDIDAARLRGDRGAERWLRFGYAALGERTYYDIDEPETWEESVLSGLVGIATGNQPQTFFNAPENLPPYVTSRVADVAYRIFGLHCATWDRGEVGQFLRWLMTLWVLETPPLLPLALAEHVHPGLIADLLQEEPEESWTPEWLDLLRSATSDHLQRSNLGTAAVYLRDVMLYEWARPDDL